MILEKLFITNTELLKEPEVQSLIEYVKEQHFINYNKYLHYKNINEKILELAIYSDQFIKGGRSSSDTVKMILEVLNEN